MDVKFLNLDAGESVFFARQLERVKAQTYDIKYPELKATALIPVSMDAGSAAETITYESYDQVGIAKMISNYADDLPRADVKGRQYSTPVRSLGDSYGYNIQEIRASAMANKNLPTRKANAARRAIDKLINDIAWFAKGGQVDGGLTGLIYNANITKVAVTTRGGHVKWSDKTADEILADMNEVVADQIALTKGQEVPDTLALPINQYSIISTTPRSSTSDTTILDFFLKNNPSIRRVVWVQELAGLTTVPSTGAASAGIDVMICYKASPDNLTLEIPQAFEQFAAEPRGLEFVVPCHARCGGVIVYYPLSVTVVEGI